MSKIPDILRKYESDLASDWIRVQIQSTGRRADLLSESELRDQSTEFLRALQNAASGNGNVGDVNGPAWGPVRDILAGLSRSRAKHGFSPSETATFIFSFKQPLFTRLRAEIKETDALFGEIAAASELLDKLGLFTTECYQRSREEIIERQQQDMLELSTPVVKLWDGVLALPLIGTLDSARTQVVMESLLQKIVDTASSVAIIDITGVPTVDTLVAQHLIKTVTAARLMGADCIISGIRPQIAQTIVHLGVGLGEVTTKATLADAFQVALQRTGQTITKLPTAVAKH
jgi:rsbT co-antagonist protein RsbR